MTPLKQQISLIPFSIEHWYSPYKRRRFENRWDQTFCILLTGPPRGGGVAGASAPGPGCPKGAQAPSKNLSWCEKRWKRAGRNGIINFTQAHCSTDFWSSSIASGLYCKILTLYKIIQLIQCTTNAWFLRFLKFLRLFLFVYKNTNSSDVWSHWECLLLGWYPKDLFMAGVQMRWGHNLLLFLVSLKSSP